MRFALLLVLLGVSLSANAAEKYTVILKKQAAMSSTVVRSTTQIKSDLKQNTYKAIASLNSRLAVNSGPASFFSFATPPANLKITSVLWGINGFVAELDASDIQKLQASGLVQYIRPDKTIQLNPSLDVRVEDAAATATYGLELTNVVALRQAHPEITGKGVVIGVIDSGVAADHPDLLGKVIKFKDFTDAAKVEPYDDNGHGTHVSGTMVGGDASGTAIGVAPEAKLISAKIFDKDGSAQETGILQAMQWMMDPDDNPETNDQPAVVSNSWGGGQDSKILKDDPYVKMLDSWIAVGMFPSFAAGNDGPSKGTVGVPGGIPSAFGVGAVDKTGTIAKFSSRGPIQWQIDAQSPLKNYVKPDISAPGVAVYSSIPGGQYASYSGTSMATPHVSAIVALVKQANPSLTVDEIKTLLVSTARGSSTHNNTYGAGIIDAKAAVLKALGE